MRRRKHFEELERNVGAVEGRDGWLFLSGDSNDVIGQHTGLYEPDREWNRDWSRILRRRRRLMRRLRAEWVCMVVPDKEAVYADKLPPHLVPAPRRPVHRLLEIAEAEGVEIIYPLAELRAGRTPKTPVYTPTDSHWNARGAYIAYRLICEHLRRRGIVLHAVDEQDVSWFENELVGDLGIKFEPPRGGTVALGRIRSPRARLVSDNQIRVTGRRLEFECDRDELPRCVVFGTSYATWCLPLLAESFRRLSFVHTSSLDRRTLRAERPQVVITMTAERGLRRIPVDRRAAATLAAVEEQKRLDGVLAPPGELDDLGLPPRAS